MGGINANTVAIHAKLNAKEVVTEGKRASNSIEGMGTAAKKAGEEAEKGNKHLQKTEEHTTRLTKATEKHHSLLRRSRGLMENVVGAVGVTAGVAGIAELVKAGVTAEGREAAVRGSLKRTGQLHEQTMAHIDKATTSSSLHGGFTTGEQLQGIAQFVSMTKSASKAMQMNAAATDLARGAHIGYAQTQKMVAQASSGSVGQLQKYLGPIVAVKTHQEALTASIAKSTLEAHRSDQVWKLMHPHAILYAEALKKATPAEKEHAKLLDKQSTAQRVLGMIQQKYAGATNEYNKTNAAQMTNMGNRMDDIKTKLGKALLPLFLKASQVFSKFIDGMIKHWPEIWAVAGPPLKAIGKAIGAIVTTVAHSSTALKVLGGIVAAGIVLWLTYKAVQLGINIVEGIGTMITWAKTAAWYVMNAQLVIGIAALNVYAAAQWVANAAMLAFPIVAIIVGLIALGVGIYEVVKHWHVVWNVMKDIGKWILDHSLFIPILGPMIFVVKQIISHWGGIVSFFKGLVGIMKTVGEAIWGALLGSFKWLINTLIIAPLNFVIGIFNKMATAYNDLPIHIGTAPHVAPIPKLAAGGLVRRAGSAIVGERGPEILSLPQGARVDPLKGNSGGLLGAFEGTKGDMHVHVEVAGKEIATAVLKEFRKMEARI